MFYGCLQACAVGKLAPWKRQVPYRPVVTIHKIQFDLKCDNSGKIIDCKKSVEGDEALPAGNNGSFLQALIVAMYSRDFLFLLRCGGLQA